MKFILGYFWVDKETNSAKERFISWRVPFHLTIRSIADAQQSATFKVEEIMENSERFENYMTTMANKLNLGESVKSSSKFNADLTFIRMPKGGKSGRQKALVGKRSLAEVLKKKHSVVQITNSDELCCARAICVAKAWIHKDEGYRQKIDYENVKRCETVQSRMAH